MLFSPKSPIWLIGECILNHIKDRCIILNYILQLSHIGLSESTFCAICRVIFRGRQMLRDADPTTKRHSSLSPGPERCRRESCLCRDASRRSIPSATAQAICLGLWGGLYTLEQGMPWKKGGTLCSAASARPCPANLKQSYIHLPPRDCLGSRGGAGVSFTWPEPLLVASSMHAVPMYNKHVTYRTTLPIHLHLNQIYTYK